MATDPTDKNPLAPILDEIQATVRNIARQAFIQGFVAARDPKTPGGTLQVLHDAETAFAAFVEANPKLVTMTVPGVG